MSDIIDLKSAASKINSNKKQELANYIGGVHEEIVMSHNNAKLPEDVFKEYFLDFFQNGDVDNINTPLMAKWIELSGSPYNEVDVYNNQGNVMYTVPPVLARPTIGDKPITNVDFSNIAGTYKLKANRLTQDADKYLNNKLNGLEKQVVSDSQDTLIRDWHNIFSLYNRPTDASHKDTPVMSASINDMIDYD